MTQSHEHRTASLPTLNNRHRLTQYRRFMRVHDFQGREVLDIGPANYISRELRIRHNTEGDLNYSFRAPRREYDVITCFEILQHAMNPLWLIERTYNLLRPGGRLYVATPKLGFISWYCGPGNFVEYKPDRLRVMFMFAGFRVVRYEVHNPWPWRFIFYGLRPPLRFLLNRYQLWELERPDFSRRFTGADV